MSILSALRRTVSGAVILNEWLGEGGRPVPQEKSNARALVCSDCPENRDPGWLERNTNAIAGWIRKALEVKNELGYNTNRDSQLHMCRNCGCNLLLKVHVPIEHIRHHNTDDQIRACPPKCWQRVETSL